jgi:hypothetical protein
MNMGSIPNAIKLQSPKKSTNTEMYLERSRSGNMQNIYTRKLKQNDEDLEEEDEEEKGDDECLEKGESIRQNKGLKILSIIVKEIVKEKVETTYKEVAEVIIRENLRFQNRGIVDSEKYKKAEQNIKRRVYDALNVLISASILVKTNKKVKINENNTRICINEKRNRMNIMNSDIVRMIRKTGRSRSRRRRRVSRILSPR